MDESALMRVIDTGQGVRRYQERNFPQHTAAFLEEEDTVCLCALLYLTFVRMSTTFSHIFENHLISQKGELDFMNYDKLEALAKEKGVSKTFLCQIVGRERYYLRDCKKNNFIPPEEHIKAWADALSTTADYLTDKTDQKEKPTSSEVSVDDILKAMLNLPREKKEELLVKFMQMMKDGE